LYRAVDDVDFDSLHYTKFDRRHAGERPQSSGAFAVAPN
jgi:hypothetical protein